MAFIKAHPIITGLLALTIVGSGGLAAAIYLWIKWREPVQALLAGQFYLSVILSLVVFGLIMTAVAYSIWLERKISAWMQDRYGPNRVGPMGLFQPIATA